MKRSCPAGLVLALLLASACASPPPEPALRVSDIQPARLESLRASHEDFVRRYYAALDHDVEQFIEERWTPAFIETFFASPEEHAELRHQMDLMLLDAEELMSAVGAETPWPETLKKAVSDSLSRTKSESRMDFGLGVLAVASDALTEIGQRRDEMHEAVLEQRDGALAALAEMYGSAETEHHELRGLLDSVTATEPDAVRDAVRDGRRHEALAMQEQELDQLRRSGERARRELDVPPGTPEQTEATRLAFIGAFLGASATGDASPEASANRETDQVPAADDATGELDLPEETPAREPIGAPAPVEEPAQDPAESESGAGGESPGA